MKMPILTKLLSPLSKLLDQAVGADMKHLARSLLRTAFGAFGMRLFNNILMFGMAIGLARLLGAADYGAYSFGLAGFQLLLVLVLFGSRALVTREVAQASATEDGRRVAGIIRFTMLVSLSFSAILIAFLLFGTNIFHQTLEPRLALALSISLWSVPVVAFMDINAYALRGLGRVTTGLLGEYITQPITFVLLASCAALWAIPVALTLQSVLWFSVISWTMAALVMIVQWQRLKPNWSRNKSPEIHVKKWITIGANMLFIGFAMQVASRIDRVMLGTLADAASVGVYTIASRITEAAEQFVFAIQSVLAPTIARAYASGEIAKMKKLIRVASLAIFCLTSLVILTMMVFSTHIFGLFGEDFTAANGTFYILGVNKMVFAFAGPAMVLLSMTNHAKLASAGIGFAALLNIALNAIFIPRWGADGAAYATLLTTIVWSGYLSFTAYMKIGINPCALGPIGNREVPQPPATSKGEEKK